MIELVMYTPLLMFMIFLTLQIALAFLGNQAAGAAARETARVARSAGAQSGSGQPSYQEAIDDGRQYAASVGRGLITGTQFRVEQVNGVEGPQIRVTVTATGIKLVPGVPGLNIRKVVQSPIEEFHPDVAP